MKSAQAARREACPVIKLRPALKLIEELKFRLLRAGDGHALHVSELSQIISSGVSS
jgi:hypothetical protein